MHFTLHRARFCTGTDPTLPDMPPSLQHRVRSGTLKEALKPLARHLHKRRHLDLTDAFVDASFTSAEKLRCTLTCRGKGIESCQNPTRTPGDMHAEN